MHKIPNLSIEVDNDSYNPTTPDLIKEYFKDDKDKNLETYIIDLAFILHL